MVLNLKLNGVILKKHKRAEGFSISCPGKSFPSPFPSGHSLRESKNRSSGISPKRSWGRSRNDKEPKLQYIKGRFCAIFQSCGGRRKRKMGFACDKGVENIPKGQ